MESSVRRGSVAFAVIALAVVAQAQYVQQNLVSDGFVTANAIDPNLVNPWGLAYGPTGPWWISDNGPSVSTLYNGQGIPFPVGNPLVVNVLPPDSAPTGIVFNGGRFNTASGFNITKNGVKKPAVFMFATEGGQICGWNPQVDATNAITVTNEGDEGAIYKGAALLHDKLYVTNFGEGTVDVYDKTFHEIGHFTDPNLPAGYAPFGIEPTDHAILIVTFALKDGGDDKAGPGHGFVDFFSEGGTLVRRFASHGVLNSPWGIAVAPSNFGAASGNILIGNFGDGRINRFTNSGISLGPLRDNHNNPIHNDGLWGMRFGNGATAGATNTLFFTAGLNGEADGLFGSIRTP